MFVGLQGVLYNSHAKLPPPTTIKKYLKNSLKDVTLTLNSKNS